MHLSHGWYIHHNYSIYNVILSNSCGSGLQPLEPEPQSPLYYSHSIMSIRMALYYISTSPSFHHICLRTSHLTIHIILVNSHIHKHVLSLQELKVRLTLRQSCLPSLARIVRTGEPISEPGFPFARMSEPISGLILVRMSTVLLLQWHSCQIFLGKTNDFLYTYNPTW